MLETVDKVFNKTLGKICVKNQCGVEKDCRASVLTVSQRHDKNREAHM